MGRCIRNLDLYLSWPKLKEHPKTLNQALDLGYVQISTCVDHPSIGNVYVNITRSYVGVIFSNAGQFGGLVLFVPKYTAPFGILNSFVYEALDLHGMTILTRPPGKNCEITTITSEFAIGEGIKK